jgi:MoxR-like ATPase
MPEFETSKFLNKTSNDIAGYMAGRLKRENKMGKSEDITNLSSEEVINKAEELINLTLEKEDLLKAVNTNEKFAQKQNGKTEDQPKSDKAKAGKIRFGRGVKYEQTQTFGRNTEITQDKLRGINQQITELADNNQVAEKFQKIMAEKIEIIRHARAVEKEKAEIDRANFEKNVLLAQRNSEDVKLTNADRQQLLELEKETEERNKSIKELMSVPEIFYEVKRREMLEFRRQLLNGGFVETESVKHEIGEILGHRQLGIPVFLRGHLGAGKTEILLHTARKYYGVEPEFISGSEEATKYDIYGKTQIGVRGEEDKTREYEMRIDEYKKNFPEATAKEIKQAEKEYYDTIMVKGQTSSFFQYGPLVRAMKEGKPIIIDEIDGIPHSILMRLNHVLTRKPGDKIKIQENGGEEITIADGFCVMATGNIKSAKYKREDLDAAFLSRWWSSEVKYLPPDETLKIITASLIDRRGNLELKDQKDFDSIKRLTQAAEEIQKIFAGVKIDVLGEGGDAARGIGASLEKSTLSMRDLWNIVKPWKAGNFQKPLEDYILTDFIKKATVPRDQVYLTQLFCRFGFFKEWDESKFNMPAIDKKKLDAFRMVNED